MKETIQLLGNISNKKMIKKILILILFISITDKGFSQKCEDIVDPFTNEKRTTFDYKNKTVFFQLKEGNILFEIIFNYWGERNHEFEKNKEVLFKLVDGSTISMTTIRKAIPKIEQINSSTIYPGFGGGVPISNSEKFTAYSFAFLLSNTELSELSKSSIELIRIPDTDEGSFIDLKAKKRTKKKIKAIRKGAICIKSHINEI